jgi:Pretoxin HINT domain
MWYRSFSQRCSLWILLAGACWSSATMIRANDPDSKVEAVQLVAKALEAEAKGELVQREQLLAEASSLSANLSSANWYRGKIMNGKGYWESIEQCVDATKEQATLDVYEQLRATKSNDVNGHWEMARWCAQRQLVEQCRAHLLSIININPDHQAARSALGFQLVGTEWIGPDKLTELAAQSQTASLSRSKYGAQIKKLIATILRSNDPQLQLQASAELAEITDPLAIPAMEAAARSSDGAAKLVVNWLKKIDSPSASQSLARIALLHPTTDVRDVAVEGLKDKPLFDFVPQLLESLTGPIQATLVPAFDRRGNLTGYRQAFAKEIMNENRILLVDRALTSRGRTEFRRSDPLNTMLQQMAQAEIALDATSRVGDARQENREIQARNRSVVSLIADITGREFPRVPQDVWKWWDEYNESNYQAYKPARYRRDSLSFEVPQYSTAAVSGECFVAGTLISTQRGLRPIEKMAVGDMALSRNARTGELCWKPVIVCTTRPPEPTVLLQVDESKLQCTGGHLLWVSGKGWTRASQIEQGDILHTASEPAVVLKAQKAEAAQTFNLEIAENHTYFAGESRVLSHDVTPRGSSRDLVPGQRSLALAE